MYAYALAEQSCLNSISNWFEHLNNVIYEERHTNKWVNIRELETGVKDMMERPICYRYTYYY